MNFVDIRWFDEVEVIAGRQVMHDRGPWDSMSDRRSRCSSQVMPYIAWERQQEASVLPAASDDGLLTETSETRSKIPNALKEQS